MPSLILPSVVFLLVGTAIAILHHRFTGHVGFNVSDEGFLWYGVRQTRRGEVPIRDFKSYDLGRYYLLAGLAFMFGDGIVGLRKSLAVVRVLGLSLAMLAVWLGTRDMVWALATAVVVQIWYFPRWKAVDIAWSIAQVFVAGQLLDSPDPGVLSLAGMWISASWLVGINHALYAGAIASLCLLLGSVGWHSGALLPQLLPLGMGAAIGCALLAGLASLVPGLLRAYYRDKLRTILLRESTNLRLPLPRLRLSRGPVQQRAQALVFWLVPMVSLGIVAWFLLMPSGGPAPNLLAVASAVVALVYCHVAWSRADLPHLAQSLHAFIVTFAIVMAPTGWPGWLALSVLGGLSIMARKDTALFWLSQRRCPEEFVPFCFEGETTWLPRKQAQRIHEVKDLVTRYTSPGEPVLIVPMDTGLYPLLGRSTPAYEAFTVFPGTASTQQRIIDEMNTAQVTLAIVNNMALDGLESRRFSANHPLIWAYLKSEFIELPKEVLGGEYVAFRRERPEPG
jgi:hypothetical protein